MPRIGEAGVDLRVLAFLAVDLGPLGAPVRAGPGADLEPPGHPRRACRTTSARTAGTGPAARRLRGALAVGGLAVACVLVIGAGLVLKSFWRLMQVSPGFATERVLTAQIELPQAALPGRAADHCCSTRRSSNGCDRCPAWSPPAATEHLADGADRAIRRGSRLRAGPAPTGEPPEVNYRTASADYFRALDVPVIAGRVFTTGHARPR